MTDIQTADFELGAGSHRVVIADTGVTITARRSKILILRLRGAEGFAVATLMLDHPAAHGVVLRDLALVEQLIQAAKPPAPIHDELDLAEALRGTACTVELAADARAGLRLISVRPVAVSTDG